MKRGLWVVLVLAVITFVRCSNDNGTGGGGNGGGQPVISSISPTEVSRGEHVEGTITGTNLTGVTSVTLGDGIAVEEFTGASSSQINVTFTVTNNAAAGPRTITVVTPGGTATAGSLLSVIANRVPTASFTANPTTGAKNTTFTFDASASTDKDGKINSYAWDFGDNQTGTGKIATHKYSAIGDYQVTLTIRDNDRATAEAQKSVEVQEGKAPIARFFVNPEGGDTRFKFTFNATNSSDPDGTIKTYNWDFGDGKTGEGSFIEHKFQKGGKYDVTLTVTDNNGLQGSVLKEFKVDDFNEQQAIREITNVVTSFFHLYSQLDTLSARQIVVGFADAEGCNGREREIAIIEKQQEVIVSTQAKIFDGVDVIVHEGGFTGNANAKAEFKWTEKDGSKHEGSAEHFFSMVFLHYQWQICNFTVNPL